MFLCFLSSVLDPALSFPRKPNPLMIAYHIQGLREGDLITWPAQTVEYLITCFVKSPPFPPLRYCGQQLTGTIHYVHAIRTIFDTYTLIFINYSPSILLSADTQSFVYVFCIWISRENNQVSSMSRDQSDMSPPNRRIFPFFWWTACKENGKSGLYNHMNTEVAGCGIHRRDE